MFLRRSVKAQAALEFLMTYGWAILVVLIVIGALAYFGVLSPSNLLPEKCAFPVSLSCVDHQIMEPEHMIMLRLQNSAGKDMIIRGVTATSDALGAGTLCTTQLIGGAPTYTDTCRLAGAGPPPWPPPSSGCEGGATFKNGEIKAIVMATTTPGSGCANGNTGRDKNRYNITVFYSWLDSPGIMHQLPGELLARKP